jgi:hypothetical protein
MNDPQETHTQHPIKTAADPPTPLSTPPACDDGDGSAEAVAVPTRYWWLKRMLLGSAVLFVLLFAVRLWWGWIAHRDFEREVDRVVALGDPIYPMDFDPPAIIRDEDNAVLPLKKAVRALSVTTSEQQKLIDDAILGEADFEEKRAMIESLLAANQQVLELLREARDRSGADWGFRWRSPMAQTFRAFPSLSGSRALSKFLRLATEHHASVGDTAGAIDGLQSMLAVSRIADEPPLLINHLVAIANYALTARSAERILPLLDVTSLSGRANLERLVQSLIDVRESSNEFHEAILSERAYWFDTWGALAEEGFDIDVFLDPWGTQAPSVLDRATRPVLRPIMYSEGVKLLRDATDSVRASAEATWPRAKARLPKPPQSADFFGHLLAAYRYSFTTSARRSLVQHYRYVAERKMAGTALAIRLYEIDHGDRPATLDMLVPKYLGTLPFDPFGDGVQTFGYLPNVPRPRLYSLGLNGDDDGGSVAFRNSGWIDVDVADMPFFLDGSRPKNSEEMKTPVVPLPPTN